VTGARCRLGPRPGRAVVALLLTALLGLAGGVQAAEWGTIVPGESTLKAVQARFGAATRAATQKVEGYDTVQWIYEGTRAPAGMKRMVVDFGLLTPAGYRGEIVRALRLEPKPGIFTRALVLAGWGRPSGRTPEGHLPPTFFYEIGLLVSFDKAGEDAQALVFTPPQPPVAAPGGGRP
jgi:hypothetical protein